RTAMDKANRIVGSLNGTLALRILVLASHAFGWASVFWVLYYAVPRQKMIRQDFDLRISEYAKYVIGLSDAIMIYEHLIVVLFFCFLAVDFGILCLLAQRFQWLLAWSVAGTIIPFAFFWVIVWNL